MTLFSKFKPTWMVNSAFAIQAQNLKNLGFSGVIVDLDNTVLAWNADEPTEIMMKWITDLQDAGLKLMVLSNNRSEERLEKILGDLDVPYLHAAKKPFNFGFKKAQKILDLPKTEIVVIGDQVITDVCGANLFGVRNVLVRPLIQTDAGVTILNRKIEGVILKRMMKKNEEMIWRDRLYD